MEKNHLHFLGFENDHKVKSVKFYQGAVDAEVKISRCCGHEGLQRKELYKEYI